ncbi:hypothetical protein KQI74_22765 [Paenibacillus barcinonensis]|uniref:hypothetical protein n=1 Tax=Paenibacillus barcinonensis TaxID=198119 RepID=UPI001C1249F9|nr:hypothetical protein [Paenibacillus barcinonensis]
MLTWDSDVWGKLSGPYGSAENVPKLLQQLEQEYSQEVFDELFQEFLFHQNSIYTATYAVMPFLAQLASSVTDIEVRTNLFIHCGIIEASRDEQHQDPFPESWEELADVVGSASCTRMYNDYMKAIDQIKSLTDEVLDYAAQSSADDIEKRYLLIADAAFHQSCNVANMLLTFIEGEEYVTVCPACGEDVYIWPQEDKTAPLQAYEHDPVFNPEQQPYAITPASSLEDDPETKALAEQTSRIGDQTLAAHLPYLAGTTTCPACREAFPIWSALLDTFTI